VTSAETIFALETDAGRAVHGTVRPLVRLRFAYADPPYLGMAKATYGDRHEHAGEFDTPEAHAALIRRLCDEWPDGWAMSLHVPSLRVILGLCPEDVRVACWCKPWAPFRPGNKHAHYAWEPVIFRGGRPFAERCHCHRDYTVTPMVLGGAKTGFGKGTKPEGFTRWVLESLLNADPADEITDLFPGSGSVTRAIEAWRAEGRLPLYQANADITGAPRPAHGGVNG